MFGSHDITHCMKFTCPKASKCHRYLMYEDAVKKDMKYITVISPECQKDTECDMFWEEKNNGEVCS